MSAAQDFLDEKLSKNKYTIKQQETLDANGGFSVANASEGVIPGGDAYKKYGKMPGSESSNSSTTTTTTATSTWDGKNYSQGAFNADDLKNHFGLQDGTAKAGYNAAAGATDGDKAKDNDLLGKGYLSNEKYESLKSDSKIKDAYAAINGQDAADKKFKDGSISINTMDALFDDLTARANTETVAAEPEKERTPIEHSPEVKQAKERVANYENDVLSGKMSQDIFEGANDPGNEDVFNQDTTSGLTLNNMDRINDKYSLNIDQGMNGIGTPAGAEPKSTEATQSFLEAKKTDLKKTYGFKPSTAKIQYGVN